MKKLNILFEEVNSECDGCKYFDMNSIYNNVEFDKPLYSLVAKRKVGNLRYVTPKQYIYKIAMGFGGLSYEDALQAYDGEVGEKYAKAMKNGDKFPVGYFTVDSERQEGRHRAMAAMKLGANKIPVMEFKEIGRDEFIETIKQYVGKSFEELNDIFVNNGHRGITRLGYNDLTRFIDYNPEEFEEKELKPNSKDNEDGLNKIFKEM